MDEAHVHIGRGDRRVRAFTEPSCDGDRPLSDIHVQHVLATQPRGKGVTPDAVATAILDSLDDAKAEDVLSISLLGKTSIADSMILATGRSTTHVGAIADRVTRACKDIGLVAKVEGLPHCDWVLVDAGDVILHIFRSEVRQFYNLEKLWGLDRPSERQAG